MYCSQTGTDQPSYEFVFGRGPECHVRPNSELVSRQHCLLKVRPSGDLSIRDLGSANGTLVNGSRVIGERLLQLGDTLQVGPVVLQVVTNEPAQPVTSETAVVQLDQTATDMPNAEAATKELPSAAR